MLASDPAPSRNFRRFIERKKDAVVLSIGEASKSGYFDLRQFDKL